jgi:hypothetical protein
MVVALPAAPGPYAIFARARSHWASQQYPSVVDYTVRVNAVDESGAPQVRHYHEFWRAWCNCVVVQPPVSDEQLANPYKPSGGFTIGIFGGKAGDVGGPGMGVKGDLFDVPALAPNYSFGIAPSLAGQGTQTPAQLVEQIRREYHDPAPAKIAQLEQRYGLKTIATVVSTQREYAITLAGVDTIDGHADYHLTLRPLQDPQKYRLRDMWVECSTYATDKLRVGANFNDDATEHVPWIVNLQQWNGATYVTNEVAEAPLDGYRGRMYDSFSVAFSIDGTDRAPFAFGGSSGGGSLSEP